MRTCQQKITQNVTGMVVILAAIVGCSGASNSDGSGVGGAANGGAPANGGTTGGPAIGGSSATTGGVVSTGGAAVTGGNASRGGTNANGGAESSGGANATGGVTSGGTVSTGGTKAIGGSSTTGGSATTGGASAAGGTSATGGKAAGGLSATGGASAAGGSNATGGKATGGASATGGSGNGTGGAATTGGSTGTGTCPKGPTKGSDVAVIGESFIAMTHGITKEIEAKAQAAGSLASGDTYKDKSVSGTLLSGSNANAIPKQYDSAVPVKFVLMDGGGNDCLQANDGDAALAAATTLFQKMGTDGVQKVQYFFYPDPIGSQYASLKTCLDALRPKMKALCDGLTAPKCYWLDLRTVWNGHSEYTSDGIHPTATGSTVTGEAIWAEMVKNCIAQ